MNTATSAAITQLSPGTNSQARAVGPRALEISAEHRRLCILRLLLQSPGYVTNEGVLYGSLPQEGFLASSDLLRNDLLWLLEMGFIELAREASWVSHLTKRGQDIATGRAVAWGVAAPPGKD